MGLKSRSDGSFFRGNLWVGWLTFCCGLRRGFRYRVSRILALVMLGCLTSGCITPRGILPLIPTNKTASIMQVQQDKRMVTMGAYYTVYEKPTVDWAEARKVAAAHCEKMMGSNAADPTGPTRRECKSKIGSDCHKMAILGDYVCR